MIICSFHSILTHFIFTWEVKQRSLKDFLDTPFQVRDIASGSIFSAYLFHFQNLRIIGGMQQKLLEGDISYLSHGRHP